MKKIMFFVPCFASGGAEAFIVNVVEKLNTEEYVPVVLSIDEQPTIYDARLKACNTKRIVLIKDHIGNPIKRYINSYRIFDAFLKKHAREYAAIHFNIAQGEELPFIWMAKRAGVPIRILHSHNSSVNSKYKYVGHVLCKILLSNVATHFCACSDIAAEWLVPKKQLITGEYEIIKNGIDTEKYRFDIDNRVKIRKDLGICEKKVLLNIGRLGNQKNHSFLLDVFKRVHDSDPSTVLLVAGEGDYRSRLEEKTKALGLEDSVFWLGNRQDIPALFAGADLFLLPSLYEGLPFTLVEAQAAGIPCLISNTISEQCVLTDLVTLHPLDVSAYADAVDAALCDLSIDNRGKYPQEIVKAGFDIGTTVRVLEKYYLGVD